MISAPRGSYGTVVKNTLKTIATGSARSGPFTALASQDAFISDLSVKTVSKNQTGLPARTDPIIMADVSRQADTANGSAGHDVVVFTEIWLKSGVYDTEILCSVYRRCRYDRKYQTFSNGAIYKVVRADSFVLPEDVHHRTLYSDMNGVVIYKAAKLTQLKYKYLFCKVN
uniref:Uncharacterized protein n=1 Tax=Glossina palpalis gambiensis TaxID=67801 RepID=A0A1B0C2D8_9MUSC